MCENAYLSIKNPKASRALKRALDPGRRMLASLARLRFGYVGNFRPQKLGPPLDQILDPHLRGLLESTLERKLYYVTSSHTKSVHCHLDMISIVSQKVSPNTLTTRGHNWHTKLAHQSKRHCPPSLDKLLQTPQVRIQYLVKGGLLRPKVADVAKRAICGRGPGPWKVI